MTEREPAITAADPEPVARPPYEQMATGLMRLLATTGWTVTEGFPRFMPRGSMSDCNYAERTITLHPWIAPRVRAEVLLREGVKRLVEKQSRKHGKQQAEAPRSWIIHGLVGRRYGMDVDERNAADQPSPTLAEELLANRIVAAIDGELAISEPAAASANGAGQSETVFETTKPKRTRARKGASSADS